MEAFIFVRIILILLGYLDYNILLTLTSTTNPVVYSPDLHTKLNLIVFNNLWYSDMSVMRQRKDIILIAQFNKHRAKYETKKLYFINQACKS